MSYQILRLLGDISTRRHDAEAEQAATYYRQALTLAHALGMCRLQAHCHFGLGTLYNRTQRGQQARVELSTAIDLYGAMEMMFWLPQAEVARAPIATSEA